MIVNENAIIIPCRFSDQPTTVHPWTVAQLMGWANQWAAMIKEASYNTMMVTPTVLDWVTTTTPSTAPNLGQMATDAWNAAVAQGYGNIDFRYRLHPFPHLASFWWQGLADIGGWNSWYNGTPSGMKYAHETGHNRGLNHASAISFGGFQSIGNNANPTKQEYKDSFDSMGGAGNVGLNPVHYCTPHKKFLNWLDADGVPSTFAVDQSTPVADARIGVFEIDDGLLKAIIVNRSRTDIANHAATWDWPQLYIESRKAVGADALKLANNANVTGGVLLHMMPGTTDTWSYLVDCTINTNANLNDPALVAGKQLLDHGAWAVIACVGADSTGAEVRVTYLAPGDVYRDGSALGVALQAPAPGSSVSGKVTVSVTAAAPQKAYRMLLDGMSKWSISGVANWNFTWDTTTLAAGHHTLMLIATAADGVTQQSIAIAVKK